MFAVSLTVLKTQHFAKIVATPLFSSPTWPFLLRFAHAHFTPAHPHGFSWARHCSVNCNKKVNHEMPAERFSSSLAPRYCAHFISAAI
jgi:hypothetical protein